MDELFVVLNDIKDILLNFINLKFIISIILIILNCCLGLYVAWFGIRKVIEVVKNALNGNLSIFSSIESAKARKWYKKEGYKYYDTYADYVESYNNNVENDIYIH